ncbi:MAG: hypothetical protein KatS3mg073_0096 [Meiothermus sp.]|nr:MAG: hypothetical protein KatS3mg073_0096 [Meiothermus sp.]
MEAAVSTAPSVRFLNPAWFASVMGTGALALALAQFGLIRLAVPVYALALVALVGLLGLYLAKLFRYPQAALADLQHPLFSQMLPTLPIALLVLSLATRALPLGPWSQPLGQGLFLLGTPLIFAVGLLVVYVVSTRPPRGRQRGLVYPAGLGAAGAHGRGALAFHLSQGLAKGALGGERPLFGHWFFPVFICAAQLFATALWA